MIICIQTVTHLYRQLDDARSLILGEVLVGGSNLRSALRHLLGVEASGLSQ